MRIHFQQGSNPYPYVFTQDILALNEYSKRHSSFTRLHSLTITTPTNFATGLAIWCKKLVTLVADAPLQKLHVYSRSDTRNQMLPDEFCAAIAYAHQKTLMRFSVHRIGVSLEGIRLVCHFCYKLEELFVVVDKLSLVSLALLRNTLAAHDQNLGAEPAGHKPCSRASPADGPCQLCLRRCGRR